MTNSSRFSILQSSGFVLGLILLLLNDFYFKASFHNWFTGKLSDFAGLFIFPIFWSVLFPKARVIIYWLTALCFIIWKSPLSNSFIEQWNDITFLFTIGRVVDYSDYVALVVLPFSYYYYQLNTHWQIRISPGLVLLVASFAFMATSYAEDYKSKSYHYDVKYSFSTDRKEVLETLQLVCITNEYDIQPDPSDLLSSDLDTLRFTYANAAFEIYQQQSNTIVSLKHIEARQYLEKEHTPQEVKEILREQFEENIISKLRKATTIK